MDELLKPCPFCGCEMAIVSVPGFNMEDSMYFLVGNPEHAKECMFGVMPAPRSHYEDILVKLWNRRASDG